MPCFSYVVFESTPSSGMSIVSHKSVQISNNIILRLNGMLLLLALPQTSHKNGHLGVPLLYSVGIHTSLIAGYLVHSYYY